jgi:hypothetical protein
MRWTWCSWPGVAEPASIEAVAPRGGGGGRAAWAIAAGVSWLLLCVRWFDAAAPIRPRALDGIPPWMLAAVLIVAVVGHARPSPSALRAWPADRVWLVIALALLFRLPMVWQGAAAYITADGALSGLMALDLRDGRAHDVFVPHVPYSGSMKAHLTAPLAAVMDPARAFALVSVLFYGGFVAAVYRLAERAAGRWGATAAGLYTAFAPAYVTRYSLSNDGNYVEVLALGTWALVLAVRWADDPVHRGRRAFSIGVLLGLAFWSHILAVIPAAAIALFLLWESPRAAVAAAARAAPGFIAGDLPGLLWNATSGWDSFAYLRPGAAARYGDGPMVGAVARAATLVQDQLLVLLGYDFGYPLPVDRLLTLVAAAALLLLAVGIALALGEARGERGRPWRLVLLLTLVNLAVALLALPYIPGNPRYLLFSMAGVPVLLARAATATVGRVALAVVIATGALASLAQAIGAVATDRQWRAFVQGLEAEGVRWCYTDFHLATKVNFLSGQRVTCSAKLGPTTTEYFFRFRAEVDAAPEAALIAVNATNALKLERRLDRLGVTYARRDLMKPVLLRLSRKVGPEELFPGRSFPLR